MAGGSIFGFFGRQNGRGAHSARNRRDTRDLNTPAGSAPTPDDHTASAGITAPMDFAASTATSPTNLTFPGTTSEATRNIGATSPETVASDTTAPGETVAATRNVNSFANDTDAKQSDRIELVLTLIRDIAADGTATGTTDGTRIRTAYAQATVIGRSGWNCFFRIDDGLIAAADLLRRHPAATGATTFFARGQALVDDYRAICTHYHIAEPTEIRLTIDPATGKTHSDIGYQPLYSDIDPMTAWAQQIQTTIA